MLALTRPSRYQNGSGPRVPPAQTTTTISVLQDRPLSQTKPVRATKWLIPRFNPVAPPGRVQSAGVSSMYPVCLGLGPAFHIAYAVLQDPRSVPDARSCVISLLTLLSRRVVSRRKSEEKIPEGISAGDTALALAGNHAVKTEIPTQTPQEAGTRISICIKRRITQTIASIRYFFVTPAHPSTPIHPTGTWGVPGASEE